MSTQPARGFTLIELVVFIAIAGLAAAVLVQAYTGTARGASAGATLAQASQLAQQRMEVIVGQRQLLGFSKFNGTNYDPCQLGLWTGGVCATVSLPTGNFSVRSTAPVTCGTGCLEVTVTAVDPLRVPMNKLTREFWNY